MSHLVPCLSCRRHVSAGDDLCPFCGVALSPEQRASVPPEQPRRRLGRAALFTFGAATLLGGAACSDGTGGGKDGATDAPAVDGGGGSGGGGGGTGGSGSGGSGTGGQGTGGSGSGGSGTGGRGTGGSGTGGQGTGGSATGGGVAPPYGIAPLYGAPATDE